MGGQEPCGPRIRGKVPSSPRTAGGLSHPMGLRSSGSSRNPKREGGWYQGVPENSWEVQGIPRTLKAPVFTQEPLVLQKREGVQETFRLQELRQR